MVCLGFCECWLGCRGAPPVRRALCQRLSVSDSRGARRIFQLEIKHQCSNHRGQPGAHSVEVDDNVLATSAGRHVAVVRWTYCFRLHCWKGRGFAGDRRMYTVKDDCGTAPIKVNHVVVTANKGEPPCCLPGPNRTAPLPLSALLRCGCMQATIATHQDRMVLASTGTAQQNCHRVWLAASCPRAMRLLLLPRLPVLQSSFDP